MSEFRQDLVSGDWIIIAPGRMKRPSDFLPEKKDRLPSPLETCPFEDLEKSGNGPIADAYPNQEAWKSVLIPNKFPAFEYHDHTCAVFLKQGPYNSMTGVGLHELVITREHTTRLADLPPQEMVGIFQIMQNHYKELAKDDCLIYTSIFFNWGPAAGASLFHPHFQVATLPAIPPHIEHSLEGSEHFYKNNNTCAHCVLLEFEMKEKKRIVAENEFAIAISPFAARKPFEVRIFPKRHQPYFEATPADQMAGVAAILQQSLKAIETRLHDPDLNFFIHTSPLKQLPQHAHYHWHIEILPKLAIRAGFELGTGVEINVIDPDHAAQVLRGEE